MSKIFRFILCIVLSHACTLLAMNNREQNHYEALGLERTATRAQIIRAFRDLSRQWHPDRNDSPEATQMSQRINAAGEILRNEQQRQEYDRSLCICGNHDTIPVEACGHSMCEEHLAQVLRYAGINSDHTQNQCLHCHRNFTEAEMNALRGAITLLRLQRQRPTIDQTHCAFCDRERTVYNIGCGHRVCARHFYRDFIQANNRECMACRNNHIWSSIGNLPEDFVELFRNFERNMARDRDYGRPAAMVYEEGEDVFGNPMRIPVRYDMGMRPLRLSNICIMCTERAQRYQRINGGLGSGSRINLPTCGHCFCMDCAQERFVNQNDRYCPGRGCEADIIGMTDEQATQVRQRISNYRESVRKFTKFKIALGATAAVGIAGWLCYEWWQVKKSKKAEKEKKQQDQKQQNNRAVRISRA